MFVAFVLVARAFKLVDFYFVAFMLVPVVLAALVLIAFVLCPFYFYACCFCACYLSSCRSVFVLAHSFMLGDFAFVAFMANIQTQFKHVEANSELKERDTYERQTVKYVVLKQK